MKIKVDLCATAWYKQCKYCNIALLLRSSGTLINIGFMRFPLSLNSIVKRIAFHRFAPGFDDQRA